MTERLKILTMVGTRPEIIKLAETIKELDRYTKQVLVHTGQNYDYELNQVFFEDLGLRKPDYFLEAAGETPSRTVANVIAKIDEVLAKETPNALLLLGDTNSCVGAYAAKRRKIPIFHMEAGNRCFDMRVAEEVNRTLVDHLSDINLVYSEAARRNLLREGLPEDRVFKTDSPLYEVLMKHKSKIESSNVLERLKLEQGEYFVLSSHREENIGLEANFKRLLCVIETVANTYDKPIIFSCHPRTQKKIDAEGVKLPKQVQSMKPLGLFDYVKLEMNALCVLSDSGTISEESSMMNFPAVNVRETHERQEAMDEGAVIMAGLNPERVIQAIEIAREQRRGPNREFPIVADYDAMNVSKKVVRIIVSYVDYIRRVVWSERIQ